MLKVIKKLVYKGRPNRPGRAMVPRYITIHETGNRSKGANAEAHASYLQTTTSKVSWHYTVDENCAYQHIPDNEVAFHAGTASGNNRSIGIEICVNKDGDFSRACKNAVELVRNLMRRYNISITNVVQHNYWNGKNCPENLRKSGWKEFIALCAKKQEEDDMTKEEVIAIIKEYEKSKAKEAVSDWAKEGFNAATKFGTMDGSAPKSYVTREMLATILRRLGFFK